MKVESKIKYSPTKSAMRSTGQFWDINWVNYFNKWSNSKKNDINNIKLSFIFIFIKQTLYIFYGSIKSTLKRRKKNIYLSRFN